MPTTLVRQTRAARAVLALTTLSAFLLTGCEAPLDLEAVRESSQQAVKRTDFYQSMTQNERKIVLAGNTGVLLSSEDHGNSWTRINLPTNESFLTVDTCPDGSFIALTFGNIVWHGSANATNWTSHTLPSPEQMMTASCAPDGRWWAAGSFTTFQSSPDQGKTWNETALNEDAIITNLQFLDSDQAIATAEFGLLFSTDDGGTNWDVAGYLPDEFYPHSAWFISRQEGWVGGLNGFIYHTADGGESWNRQVNEASAPVLGFVSDPSALYAVGDNATVLQLNQSKWEKLPTPNQPLYLRSGLLLPNNQLLVAGGRGLLLQIETPLAVSASKD